ncbi:MAG: T9SS type A sorting domain-containing protein [candidate division WOR-3 bacterium]
MKLSMIVYFILSQWSAPINFGIPGVEDCNPQTCREQLWEGRTCLVWQAFTGGGGWEIYSRFIGYNWSDTVCVSNSSYWDINPSVAYDTLRNCFWCVWQNNFSGINYQIHVSYSLGNSWTPPARLTNDLYNNTSPSVCVVGTNVWVVWKKANNIYSCYYDGTSWSAPIPVTNDASVINYDPKISNRHNHPFVVWVREGDIYYSEYINNAWTTPQAIAPHPAEDIMPEIAVTPQWPDPYRRVWVVWQSNRDGNYELYRTGCDSLNVFYRITNNTSNDIDPNPLDYMLTVRESGPPLIGFSSDRNGTYDIYSLRRYWTGGYDTIPVDINPAEDILPVTTMVNDYPSYLWIFWETNRNGDQDIYGSYITLYSGIDGIRTTLQNHHLRCIPNPLTDRCFIQYRLEKNSRINLSLYNHQGALVQKIYQGLEKPGTHYVATNFDSHCNGIYFIVLKTEEVSVVEKVIILK